MISYTKESQLKTAKQKKLQAKINSEANKKLDKIYKKLGLRDICEVNMSPTCLKVAKTSSVGTRLEMTYAHKNKRIWYKSQGNQKYLSSFEHTVRACLHCHIEMEKNRAKTLEVFKRLRPERS